MITILTAKNFTLQSINVSDPIIANGNKKIILLVKANWCHYCNDYIPKFESYSKILSEYKFCILEQTQDEALINSWKTLVSSAFDVQGYPTVVLYNNDGTPIGVIKDRKNLQEELANMN